MDKEHGVLGRSVPCAGVCSGVPFPWSYLGRDVEATCLDLVKGRGEFVAERRHEAEGVARNQGEELGRRLGQRGARHRDQRAHDAVRLQQVLLN
jgi:hypothetical protein